MPTQRMNPSLEYIPWRRRIAYLAILLGVLLLCAEATSHLLLQYAYGTLPESQRLNVYDPVLGWTNIPNLRVANRFGAGKNATHNSQGLRALMDYSPQIPKDRYRILFLGDSFTYGICGDDETYPAQLESLCPKIQAVNMGVGAYGIDQCYLRFKREGHLLDSNMVVLTFIEDDFPRMRTSVFLRNPKPLLQLRGKEIVVSNVPVPAWNDRKGGNWFQQFPQQTATFQLLNGAYALLAAKGHNMFPVAERVFDELGNRCRERGQKFVLLYLPSDHRGGNDFDSAQQNDVVRWVIAYAEKSGTPFLNLTETFRYLPHQERKELFEQPRGHYSKAGNRLVATAFLREVRKRFPEAMR